MSDPERSPEEWVRYAKRASVAVYLATDEGPARDLARILDALIQQIEDLQAELAEARRRLVHALPRLHGQARDES